MINKIWIFFCQNHFGQQKRLKIHIRGCKWVKYQCNLLLFSPFRIIKAIFNRLNLRLSQKNSSLRYINKWCSNYLKGVPIWCLFLKLILKYFQWIKSKKKITEEIAQSHVLSHVSCSVNLSENLIDSLERPWKEGAKMDIECVCTSKIQM